MTPPSFITAHILLALLSVTGAGAADGQIEIAGFPAFPDGFSPRNYGDYSKEKPAQWLAKRQGGTCPTGQHNCLDLGDLGANACCDDDRYCFFKPGNWSIGCCGFGANCDSSCAASAAVRINVTTTEKTTSTSTVLVSSSATTTLLLEESVTTTEVMCSSRPCGVESHLCPSSLGGGICCSNGMACGTGGCIVTVSPTSTADSTGTAGGICSGTTNAFTCTNGGGGCCLDGQTCTYIDATQAACACNVASPGLSTGAKAGIAVGVVVAAAIVIGAVTWFCIRQRRRNRGTTTGRSGASAGVVGPGGEAGMGGGEGGGGGGFFAGHRGPTPGGDSSTVAPMSEASGPASHRIHQTGVAYNYFGPEAHAGPYTTQDNVGTTHEYRWAPDVAQNVGAIPHGPDDFNHPVEIADGQPEDPYGQQSQQQQQQQHQHLAAPLDRGASYQSGTTGESQFQDAYELPATSPLSLETNSHGNPDAISPVVGTLETFPDLNYPHRP